MLSPQVIRLHSGSEGAERNLTAQRLPTAAVLQAAGGAHKVFSGGLPHAEELVIKLPGFSGVLQLIVGQTVVVEQSRVRRSEGPGLLQRDNTGTHITCHHSGNTLTDKGIRLLLILSGSLGGSRLFGSSLPILGAAAVLSAISLRGLSGGVIRIGALHGHDHVHIARAERRGSIGVLLICIGRRLRSPPQRSRAVPTLKRRSHNSDLLPRQLQARQLNLVLVESIHAAPSSDGKHH